MESAASSTDIPVLSLSVAIESDPTVIEFSLIPRLAVSPLARDAVILESSIAEPISSELVISATDSDIFALLIAEAIDEPKPLSVVAFV